MPNGERATLKHEKSLKMLKWGQIDWYCPACKNGTICFDFERSMQ
jgi:hypothetical protein